MNPFENAVLVLGAGASCDYGFPTGKELKEEILGFEFKFEQYFQPFHSNVDQNSRQSLFFEFLKSNDFEVDFVKEFMFNFRSTGAESIDEFLQYSNEKNQKYLAFGVYLIYYFIENKEVKLSLNLTNWIEKFVRHCMNSSYRDSFLENPPKVITFNYDRYFQNKIEYNIRENYGFSSFKYKDLIHVYGQTSGRYYFENHSLNAGNFERYKEECKSISLIREVNVEEDPKVDIIRKTIDDARKVYLLGYGFNKINNRILFKNTNNLQRLINSEVLLSTRVSLDLGIVKKIQELNPKINYLSEEINCSQLIDSIIPRFLF